MQIADYVPTWTKIMLSSAQKAHVLPVFAMHFWYGMTVYVYIQMHKLLWCSASLSVIHYQLYTEKENRFYACIEELCAHW